MKDTTRTKLSAIAANYQFQAGDLIEYRDPHSGKLFSGRIVSHYQTSRVFGEDGKFLEERLGYGCDYDGVERGEDGRPYFAYASGLRLRRDLAESREDNAFQMFLTGLLSAPRKGRPPKSPYPPAPKGTVA